MVGQVVANLQGDGPWTNLSRKETKPVPPAVSFGWPPRLFEPETVTVQSEFDPGSRLAGLKATLGTAGLGSFLI